MPTDAPDGLINAHVVQGRRPDHADPKTARTKAHEKDAVADDDKPSKADKPADKKAADKSPSTPAKE